MTDKMHFQWLSMEHYRLHIAEEWPDGPYKEATLAAIHSTIECAQTSPERRSSDLLKFPQSRNAVFRETVSVNTP
jgi:hypothetical protein